MLLPLRCPVCAAPAPAVCEPCLTELARAPAMATPAGLERLDALLAYADGGRQVVAAAKFGRHRGVLRWSAAALAVLAGDVAPDAVTWIPALVPHRRRRGFDVGRDLARRVGAHLQVPAVALLERHGAQGQGDRSALERRRGPELVAAPARGARGRAAVEPGDLGRLLVIDDVVTTGASMGAAAFCLRRAGAGSVFGVALARTPRPARIR